jgi:hypothetical protein
MWTRLSRQLWDRERSSAPLEKGITPRGTASSFNPAPISQVANPAFGVLLFLANLLLVRANLLDAS